jgi:uncharacterized membrane protein
MSADVSAAPVVPPTREFAFAWAAYVLHAVGLFMLWPALIGLIVNDVKRSDVPGSLIETHHGWMIRTFWFALLWYALALSLIVAGVWPIVAQVIESERTTGHIEIDWSAIFATAGVATVGGLGLAATWFWVVYRLMRGALRLNDGRAVP